MKKVELDIGILPWGPVPPIAELAAEAEDLGFGGIWIADSQCLFRDAYTALTLCAIRTNRLLLATGVTNPLTRHPSVTAGSIATLDEISGGRAILGMGTGESAVQTIGMRAATLKELEESTLAIRALLAGESTEYKGGRMKLGWPAPRVPIYFAASGPKTLRLAGRIADGVLFQVGADLRLVEYALDQIRSGAGEAGRSLQDIQLCMRLACSLGEDREKAREEIRPYAAAACVTTYRSLPPDVIPVEIAEDVSRLRQSYDYNKHVNPEANHRQLVTEGIIDAVAIAGTPEEAVPRFQQIARSGVDRIVIPLTVPEPRRMLKILAETIAPRLGAGSP